MSLFKKGEVITLQATIQIVDNFAYEDVVYYLARQVLQDGAMTRNLTEIPTLLLCRDSTIAQLSDDVIEYAKLWITQKYGPKDD